MENKTSWYELELLTRWYQIESLIKFSHPINDVSVVLVFSLSETATATWNCKDISGPILTLGISFVIIIIIVVIICCCFYFQHNQSFT